MSDHVKVFGHKSPDTDTTCAAIIWSWYLNNHTTTRATPYVLGELNKETSFVLNYWKVPPPALLESVAEGDDVVVVDTNNPQELFENINDTSITAIIDHHKLVGGLSSKGPLTIMMKPLASTATVMYDLIGEHTDQMPKEIKGLVLSCILSDTLEFRSPTTTPHDKSVAEKIAREIGVDIPKYAAEMFAAKSDVSDYTDKGLIHLDSKKFQVGDKNIRVSSLETTTPDTLLKRKAGLVSAIKEIVEEESDTDDVLLFIIDILKEEATVLMYNELTTKIVEASFGIKADGDTAVLPGVVSRKKQIIPVLKI